MKTLSEVVNIVGMSRRVIQEYEKSGLSKTPTTTNKYGHLLYDEKTIERLWQIRFYRELGYSKKQIKEILSDTDNNRHDAVASQIDVLERKKEKLEELIAVSKAADKWGLSASSVRFNLPVAEEMSYDLLSSLLSSMFVILADRENDDSFAPVLTETDYDKLAEALEKITVSFKQGLSAEAAEVQENVVRIHDIASKAMSDSIIIFSLCNLCLTHETELADEFDEDIGKGFAEYLFNAVRHYCITHSDNPTDRLIIGAVKKLEYLGQNKFAADSKEVRNEIRKLYGFYENIAAIKPDDRIGLLCDFSKVLESRAIKEQLSSDDGYTVHFISEAIRFFCDSFDH